MSEHVEPVDAPPADYSTGRFTTVDFSDVDSRDGFGALVSKILEDFTASGRAEWENHTLERFLEAFSALVLARENHRPTDEQERATWQLFARLVVAATGYE